MADEKYILDANGDPQLEYGHRYFASQFWIERDGAPAWRRP